MPAEASTPKRGRCPSWASASAPSSTVPTTASTRPPTPTRPSRFVGSSSPADVLEDRDAVGVPAARLPGHVQLHHRRADPLVEHGEGVAGDGVEIVGRVPELADAPLHVLLARGDEDAPVDVEVHPQLIEDHARPPDSRGEPAGARVVARDGLLRRRERGGRGGRRGRVVAHAAERERSDPVVRAGIEPHVEQVRRRERPVRGRDVLLEQGLPAQVELAADPQRTRRSREGRCPALAAGRRSASRCRRRVGLLGPRLASGSSRRGGSGSAPPARRPPAATPPAAFRRAPPRWAGPVRAPPCDGQRGERDGDSHRPLRESAMGASEARSS